MTVRLTYAFRWKAIRGNYVSVCIYQAHLNKRRKCKDRKLNMNALECTKCHNDVLK